MVIIESRDEQGRWRGSPAELAEQVLEVAPQAVCTVIRGPITGIQVSDRAGALWLMRTWTATGKRRRGV